MNNPKVFLRVVAVYYFGFAFICTFYPKLMELFQTPLGLASNSAFANHVWFHGGLDIFSLVLLIASLSIGNISARTIKTISAVLLFPAFATFYSYFSTDYWTPLFLGIGIVCIILSIWGVWLAGRLKDS